MSVSVILWFPLVGYSPCVPSSRLLFSNEQRLIRQETLNLGEDWHFCNFSVDSPEQPRFHSPVSTTYPSSGWASIFCKSSNRRDLTLYHVHNNGQAQRMTKRFLGSRRNYESRGELMLYSLRPWHYGYYLCKNGRNMTAVTRLDFSGKYILYII